MSRYNVFYYFNSVLLITGAFASMAQNDYGTTILFIVAIAFCFLFGVQLVSLLLYENEKTTLDILELAGLVVLSCIIAMRIVYVRFAFVEIAFGLAGLILIFVFAFRMRNIYRELHLRSAYLVGVLFMFYGSIILYFLSMVIIPFAPGLLKLLGVSGFSLLLAFLILGVLKKVIIEDEIILPIKYVFRYGNRAILLIILFFLFTVYTALTDADLLPKMYSNEYPQTYFDLVKQAETGKEKSVNGKFKHDEFLSAYDRFVKRNIEVEK